MVTTKLRNLRMAKDGLREAEDRWIAACQEALPEGTHISWLKHHGVVVGPPEPSGRVSVRNEKTGKTYSIYISTLLVSGLEIEE